MAFDSLIDLMPLPSPSLLLDQVRCHILATCLQGRHIAGNPSMGASDSAVVGADSELVLVMAE